MDTDPGFDDLAAIVLAAARPDLQIEGVGVVAGNAPKRCLLHLFSPGRIGPSPGTGDGRYSSSETQQSRYLFGV